MSGTKRSSQSNGSSNSRSVHRAEENAQLSIPDPFINKKHGRVLKALKKKFGQSDPLFLLECHEILKEEYLH